MKTKVKEISNQDPAVAGRIQISWALSSHTIPNCHSNPILSPLEKSNGLFFYLFGRIANFIFYICAMPNLLSGEDTKRIAGNGSVLMSLAILSTGEKSPLVKSSGLFLYLKLPLNV